MDAILTATVDAGRNLGFTSAPRREARTVWLWTGNNIYPVGDTGRRVIGVRLYSQEERPEEREFTGREVGEWAKANRKPLFVAALTVASAYIRAGRPAVGLKRMGGFESWSDLIRSALVWAGEPDPCSTRSEIIDDDPDRETAVNLIKLWQALNATGPGKTVAEMVQGVKGELERCRPQGANTTAWTLRVAPTDYPLVAAYRLVFPYHDFPDPHPLGKLLRKHKGRAFDGKRILSPKGTRKNVALWTVDEVHGMGETQGMTDASPHASHAPSSADPAVTSDEVHGMHGMNAPPHTHTCMRHASTHISRSRENIPFIPCIPCTSPARL